MSNRNRQRGQLSKASLRSSLASVSSSPGPPTPSSRATSTSSSRPQKRSANDDPPTDEDSDIQIVTPTNRHSKRPKQTGRTTTQRAEDFKNTFREGLTDEEILGMFLGLSSCFHSYVLQLSSAPPGVQATMNTSLCHLQWTPLIPLMSDIGSIAKRESIFAFLLLFFGNWIRPFLLQLDASLCIHDPLDSSSRLCIVFSVSKLTSFQFSRQVCLARTP